VAAAKNLKYPTKTIPVSEIKMTAATILFILIVINRKANL
jgi:hypothetical protein